MTGHENNSGNRGFYVVIPGGEDVDVRVEKSQDMAAMQGAIVVDAELTAITGTPEWREASAELRRDSSDNR